MSESESVHRPELKNYSFGGHTLPTIEDEALSFLSLYTSEPDLDSLRKRVTEVWQESKEKHHVYRCIQELRFLKPRTPELFYYPRLKALQPNTKIADIGCCYGTDIRFLLQEGFEASSLTACDLHSGYWDLGLKLYKDAGSPKISSIRTAFGDMTVPEAEKAPLDSPTDSFDVVLANAVLHVFNRTQCENFIHRVARLLKEQGFFIGCCVGSKEAGEWKIREGEAGARYLHSKDSLSELLQRAGFAVVEVIEKEMQRTRPSERPELTSEKTLLHFCASSK